MFWIIFLMSLADDLNCVGSACLCLLILAFVGFIASCFFDEEEFPLLRRTCKKLIIGFGSVVFLAFLVPDGKEIAAMYLLPKIANNEAVKQIPEKALNIINKRLDDWLEDSAGSKK